jgi:hypothetical protein
MKNKTSINSLVAVSAWFYGFYVNVYEERMTPVCAFGCSGKLISRDAQVIPWSQHWLCVLFPWQ